MKMMKRLLILFTLVLISAGALIASAASGYTPFSYKNFRLELPSGTHTSVTAAKAVMKNSPLRLGFTLIVDKDAKASSDRAMRLCNALVREMDVKHGSEAWRVTVGGMKGAMAEGVIEGSRISLLVLSTGSGYLKLIAIDSGSNATCVDHVMKSVRRQ